MSTSAVSGSWSAVVLCGGGGTRLGGVDKARIEVDGPHDTLLERALTAVAGAAETIVVGASTTTSRPVRFTREDPPGSGPAAALLHGVETLADRTVVVVALAVDMPLVTAGTVARLLDAASRPDVDGAVLEDSRRQPLCAAYRTTALLSAAPAPADRPGTSVRALIAGLRLVGVPALEAEGADVDEWADLSRIRSS